MSLRVLYLVILVFGLSVLVALDHQVTTRHLEDLRTQRDKVVGLVAMRTRTWLEEQTRLADYVALLVQHGAGSAQDILDRTVVHLVGETPPQWIAVVDPRLAVEVAWTPPRRPAAPRVIAETGATGTALGFSRTGETGLGLEFGFDGSIILVAASPVRAEQGRTVLVRSVHRDPTTLLDASSTRSLYTRVTSSEDTHIAGAEEEADPTDATTRTISVGGLKLTIEVGLLLDSHAALGFQRFLIWSSGVFALVGFAVAFFMLSLKAREVEEKSKVQATQSHKLREFNEKLKEVNKELDDFTYVVSHDLKEPLRGIEAFSSILAEEYSDKLEGEAKEYMATLRSSSKRMRNLIDDLLKLSRIARSKYDVEPVDFNKLVEEAREDLDYAIKSRNAKIIVEKGLPTVPCERVRMAEVLQNLMSNAIKYCDKEEPRVEIGCKEREDIYVFYVRDNGIGIDKKYYAKVFQIFQRLHRQDEYEGTGAGLTVCKRIVEKHGGKIWLESEPGKGTVFFFSLPKSQ